MYNFFIVRITNRLDGTFGNSVKAYENEPDALKEFFRQAGQRALANEIEQYVVPTPRPAYVVQNPNCCAPQTFGCGCGAVA